MHISEGILSAPVLLGGGALAAAGTAVGLKKLDYDRIMSVAMLTATFFVASLIHVRLGAGSVHLILNGLLGIVLGWGVFPAVVVALLLQSLFFQFGGITVLGVNSCIMAIPALLCYYLARPWILVETTRATAAFLVGVLAIFLSALLMAASLALTDAGFLATAQITVLVHIPVMLIEGVITLAVVSFLAKVQPELLGLHNGTKNGV
jgi:cobalt/nickel transport system permease protein